eukprot:m.11525 g.11525  ORF g.11525 m.11525 type:complete len:210 (-) comp9833_c0_seq1:105-734(-)
MANTKQFELPILELQDKELSQAMQAIINTIFLYRVKGSKIKLVDSTCPAIDVTFLKMANEQGDLSKLHDRIDKELHDYCKSFQRKPGRGRIELTFYYERKRRMFALTTERTVWERWTIPFEILPASKWRSYDQYRKQLAQDLTSVLSTTSEMALETTEHLNDLPKPETVSLYVPDIVEEPFLYELVFPEGQEAVRNWDVLKKLVRVVTQ